MSYRPSGTRPARSPGDRLATIAVAAVCVALAVAAMVMVGGCCSCRAHREATAGTTVPPPDQATDERFLAYHWYGELPECDYIELGRIDVPAPAGAEGLSAPQVQRQVELDLGRAALSSEAIPNLPVGITRADGVFGIQRAKGNIYVGVAFAFTDPDCRR
jgi:hypothetical protein